MRGSRSGGIAEGACDAAARWRVLRRLLVDFCTDVTVFTWRGSFRKVVMMMHVTHSLRPIAIRHVSIQTTHSSHTA